jgi:sirohydrochlorin cobaltochelatase
MEFKGAQVFDFKTIRGVKPMKKVLSLLPMAFLMAPGWETGSFCASAAEEQPGKKAVLVVSFGTTYTDTRKVTIEAVENKIRAAFPDYELRRAFTSRIVIKRLADREGLKVDTETQALERLKADGYTDVIIQPLHIEAGEEYEKLRKAVYNYDQAFAKIALGRPLLYYTGQEGEKSDDYGIVIRALQKQLPQPGPQDAVALMGHGGVNPANTAYAALQLKLEDAGLKNVFVFTVEGYPAVENLMAKLKKNKIRTVTLMPFMLTAGDHVHNDMAGNEADSFKSRLLKAGFQVKTYIHGLGENAGIQDIYVQHVKDAMENKYQERGKDRPPIPDSK